MVTIVDYGMGNLGSIQNMLKKIGTTSIITSDSEMILKAEKLVLSGVGAFDNAMFNMAEYGLVDPLNEMVIHRKIPILGICLGMQLFSNSSEEGARSGLGWVDSQTIRFVFPDLTEKPKVPHMGWNTVEIHSDQTLFNDMPGESRFYFVHSYHVVCNNVADRLTTTYYGIPFTSSLHHDNIYATQFHPEKSHKFGMKLLMNFVERT